MASGFSIGQGGLFAKDGLKLLVEVREDCCGSSDGVGFSVVLSLGPGDGEFATGEDQEGQGEEDYDGKKFLHGKTSNVLLTV